MIPKWKMIYRAVFFLIDIVANFSTKAVTRVEGEDICSVQEELRVRA